MTRSAIREFQQGASWEEVGQRVRERRAEGTNAGNGSVMRCAPHAIAFADDRKELVRVSRQSSAITHADPRCTWGCAALNLTLAALPDSEDPTATLDAALDRVADEAPAELVDTLRAVPGDVVPDDLRSTGYVVDTLRTALYEGPTAPSAEKAIVRAVNRGDADTVGAVTGAVAGARFGREAIPER
jgi:ADP-ribosyl-[dinitrogen reductase] hydrolase